MAVVDFGRTSVAEDLRPGFEGHSVMQFDWKRVVNRELLSIFLWYVYQSREHYTAANVESLQIKVLAIPPNDFVSQPEVCGFPFLPDSYTVNLPTVTQTFTTRTQSNVLYSQTFCRMPLAMSCLLPTQTIYHCSDLAYCLGNVPTLSRYLEDYTA